MKKITFLLTTPLLFAFYTSPVPADEYNYKPYIGADYTYNHTTAYGFSPYYNTAGIRLGSDYSHYFGTEIFFNQSNSNKRRPLNHIVKTSFRSYGLDLLAYMPLDCSNQFSLLATLGVGEYIYKTKFVPQKHYNEHGFGYRFGGGVKYVINQNWHTRFITRYVKFDHLNNYNHAIEYTTGIEYHF